MRIHTLVTNRGVAMRAALLAILALAASIVVAAPSSAASAGGTLSVYVALDGGGSAGHGCMSLRTLDRLTDDGACGTDVITMDNVAPGDYLVYLSEFEHGVGEWYGDAELESGATLVSVEAGKATYISASLAVGATIQGVITKANGSPATWGWVSARTVDGAPAGSGSTNALGEYTINGLRAGTYYLRLSLLSGSPTIWFDGATARTGATPVTVATGQTRALNYRTPAPATLNVTLDRSEPHLAVLEETTYVGIYTSSGEEVKSGVVKAATGWTVKFTDLPAGDLYLNVSNRGNREYYNGGVSFLADAVPVHLTAGVTSSATFVMPAVGSMTGTVSRANDALADEPGGERYVMLFSKEAASGKWLQVGRSCGESGICNFGVTDAAGKFTIANVMVGDYKVGFGDYAGNTNYQPVGSREPIAFYGGADLASASIVSVTAGSNQSAVNAVLQPLTTSIAPVVTGVYPALGAADGGSLVTLMGTKFTGASSVTFGGEAGTSLVVVSGSQLTVRTPAHSVGSVDVVVTTPSGSSTARTYMYTNRVSGMPAPDSSSISTVYRFWSPKNKSHFYTMSVAERDQIIRTYPKSEWTYEGGNYNAFSSQQPGTVPLYRFWSATFKGHFFTTSEAEKDQVIAVYDDETWLFEGIAYYVYPTDPEIADTVTVARFWSQDNKHHFYTASAAERDHVIAVYPDHEWLFESDAFRVPSSPVVEAPLP